MKISLPVLLLKDMVLFPHSEIRLEFETDNDKKLFSLVESYYDNKIIVINPIDSLEVDPEIEELPLCGIQAEVKMKLDMPNGKTRIILTGINRVKVHNYNKEDNIYEAVISTILPEELTIKEEMAYIRALTKHVEVYVKEIPYVSNTIISQITGINNINKMADIVASFLPVDYDRKKEYIEVSSSTSRIKMILDDINRDIEILKLEKEIESNVESGLVDREKEFVLREKLKIIKQELGEDNDTDIEILRRKLEELSCPLKVREKLEYEINRYASLNAVSPEVGMLRGYIDWLLSLPWNNYTKDRNDLKKVREILDSTHNGLDDIKDRIIEYLAVKENTNSLRSPIICLVGAPGVGKTSLAKSIAESLNRRVTKISVGGVNDEAEIVGHRRSYVGSSPGLIIQGMKKAGVTNPVFIIDEIDKMTKDIKGDPASSLLEVLDKEQNHAFTDHYIEEEFDLSECLFIATANYIDRIPDELKDRLEIIEISSYTEFEKVNIAKNHLIKNQIKEHNIPINRIKFTDESILILIRNYTKEAGIRELDRVIASIIRKIVKEIIVDKSTSTYIIDEKTIEKFLGIKKYLHNNNIVKNKIGVVNALSYTPYGGDIIPIEVCMFEGKGDFILTGSLGEVMQESARIALSYIKANAKEFNIDLKKIENKDIHIHIPDGNIPKDGPSAGIALTTSLISLFTNQNVDSTISMTGEITLTGEVLLVGGLKEKIIGASRAQLKKVFIPTENEADLKEISKSITENIEFILVDNYMQVFKNIFNKKTNNK